MTKDKEDNRDIFEKALDYAPVAGAAVGYGVARKLGRRAFPYKGRAADMAKAEGIGPSYQKASPGTAREVEASVHMDEYDRILRSKGKKAAGQYLRSSGALEKVHGVARTGIARKVGSAAGTYAGYEAGSEAKKRRK